MIDRSGRTYKEYRQLYWDEKEARKAAELKVANFESDAYVLSLLTKLDELQAQLEAIRKVIMEPRKLGLQGCINKLNRIEAAIKGDDDE